MNKRNSINLGLLVFILIVVAVVLLNNSTDKKQNKKTAITSLKQTDVTNITIKRKNRKAIYLEKKNNKWRLISPYNTATNQFRMDTLLRLVETLPYSSYPLKETAPYGLDKPALEVVFNKGKPNAVSIKFGNSEPINMRRYIAVRNKLYLTNDTYFYALNSVATDYISHKLLADNFKITRLDLPTLKLELDKNRWTATPKTKNFSIDSVNELITEWQTAQAIDINPANKKTSLLPGQTISLYSNEATRLTFYILKNDKEFILVNKLKGLQYSFPKDKQKQLLHLPIPMIEAETPPSASQKK